MKRKLLAAAAVAAATLLAGAGPALAHVTTDPESAPKGAEVTVRLRAPNEETGANIVKLDVALPVDHPLLGVEVEPIAGWTVAVTEVKLDPPVSTDDGPVAEAVSEIAWTASAGGGTPPGQFQEFPMLVQRLPTEGDAVVFKAIQTYSDGTVVRWIDPISPGQAAPEHPTPILNLTAGSDAGAATPATTTPPASQLATKSSVASARTLGIVGIALGALGIALAARRRRVAPKDTASTR
jgi:uncharacterized protein YcnI